MKPKLIKIIISVLVLGLLLLGGGYAGYRGYKSIRQARLVKQAREFLAVSDPRKAMLCLQRALRYNNRDVEACRMMAQLMEAGGSAAALVWRSRVVEVNPRSLDDRLVLAKTAIRFGDYTSATNALEGVNASGKNTSAYHNMAGTVAAAANQPAEAERHFLEAVRLDPQDATLQLNLAVVRLHGTNAAALAEARAALQRLAANPTNSTLRCQSLRELAVDALRGKKSEAALSYSGQLLSETNSVSRDRLLRLGVLSATRNAEFKPALAGFQREAAAEPMAVAELAAWQMANTTPAETLAWLHSLPPVTQTNLVVAMVMAECYTKAENWPGLQKSVEKQNWGELEFVRYAFKAHALRGQELTSAAKGEWELALKVTDNQKSALVMLLRLAAAWNWQSEGEEILWNIVNRYPDEKWAARALTETLFVGGRTRSLMKLYTQELKRSPSDLGNKNNLAMTAFLLDAKELKPHDLAREVYEKAPTNSAYASTYAFSLHLQKKDAEALKIFQALTPKALEHPTIAGYYGLVLKATGNKEKARVYFDWAFKSPMLPEERKMFEQARAGS